MMMKYCVGIKNQGLFLKPTRNWDGKDKAFEFVIHDLSDSDYGKNPENQRIIMGTRVFLGECPVMFRRGTQKYVYLSVT